MQITVVERAQKIQIQEQEIVRRERELDSKVRKPAEAEKYRLEKIAEANKSVCAASSVKFLDPEGGSQKATLVVLLVLGISSLRVQKSLRLS